MQKGILNMLSNIGIRAFDKAIFNFFFASVITLAIACLFVDFGTFTGMVSCCLKFVSKQTLSKALLIVLVITFSFLFLSPVNFFAEKLSTYLT